MSRMSLTCRRSLKTNREHSLRQSAMCRTSIHTFHFNNSVMSLFDVNTHITFKQRHDNFVKNSLQKETWETNIHSVRQSVMCRTSIHTLNFNNKILCKKRPGRHKYTEILHTCVLSRSLMSLTLLHSSYREFAFEGSGSEVIVKGRVKGLGFRVVCHLSCLNTHVTFKQRHEFFVNLPYKKRPGKCTKILHTCVLSRCRTSLNFYTYVSQRFLERKKRCETFDGNTKTLNIYVYICLLRDIRRQP